jgi:hypothetical protein
LVPAACAATTTALGLEYGEHTYRLVPKRGMIRVHDLRASFVTNSLANGKTEARVSARTGHKSATNAAWCP